MHSQEPPPPPLTQGAVVLQGDQRGVGESAEAGRAGHASRHISSHRREPRLCFGASGGAATAKEEL